MTGALPRHGAAALLAGTLLAGCAAPDAAAPTVTADDYAPRERALLARGWLRTDRAASDVPVTAATLAGNFARVAFGLEADVNAGRASRTLHRREGPLRWWVMAGGPEAAAAHRDAARTFDRLARATGLDIARSDGPDGANLHVLFLGPGDYDRAVGWARRALGRHEAGLVRDFRTRRALCLGTVRVGKGDRARPAGAHGRALVLIRKGYSDLSRLACLEEELAQVLGLANDDAAVRPSVFNDDEEFALLTEHDELLLRILYDPRLSAGMTAAEAMPLVARIAGELRPGG